MDVVAPFKLLFLYVLESVLCHTDSNHYLHCILDRAQDGPGGKREEGRGKREEGRGRRRYYLILCLIVSLGLLFVFKYLDFTFAALREAVNIFGFDFNTPVFHFLLPVGISFYTFQTLSYSIDVYRGKKTAEKHFGIFAVYVAFFPQLVAGPIERSTQLLPQFYEEHSFDYQRMTDGLKLMLWGFFKKLVIADRLAVYVNQVYGSPGDFTAWPIILATYFFAFQIYCDFSAYSDIAIGSAQVMGFRLMNNFNRPYFSKNIAEFWRRWHISLSTWFRDYLYVPLGGNRCSKTRWLVNILIVFLISGLWHGAAWTFIFWGGIHAFYLIVGIMTRPARRTLCAKTGLSAYPRFHKIFQVFITFHLVVFAWIFFRANSLADVGLILNSFANVDLTLLFQPPQMVRELSSAALGRLGLLIAVSSICFTEMVHFFQRRHPVRHTLSKTSLVCRWGAYYAIFFSILMFGVFSNEQFIYFQF